MRHNIRVVLKYIFYSPTTFTNYNIVSAWHLNQIFSAGIIPITAILSHKTNCGFTRCKATRIISMAATAPNFGWVKTSKGIITIAFGSRCTISKLAHFQQAPTLLCWCKVSTRHRSNMRNGLSERQTVGCWKMGCSGCCACEGRTATIQLRLMKAMESFIVLG